ncbi:DUF4097 family beta strand repeat-containing protein [uncultured Thomasclavelia sp.]|uniref:DUF4097 family beta strand repeat-containing protein n=1 Tax=uncultured Thomasclavelia sp. TaxID=3025759 RepID=UPI0025EC7F1D|nr:DUF4097 family beta strand repeat-containing protein [uncultured Thomasclavelia sp.]
MRKIGYAILVISIIALIFLVSGAMLGGFSELETLYHNGDYNINLPFYQTKNVVQEFRDVSNLEINCEIGTANIKSYGGSSIKVEGRNVSRKIKIEKEHETLVIKDGSQFGRIFNYNDNDTGITIYVPNDYQFDQVNLEVDAGKMTIDQLNCQELEINVDLGDFYGNQIVATQAKIEVDAGDITIDYLDSMNCDFNCDLGNITATVAGSEADYDYEVDSDLGDVTIGSYNSDSMEDKYTLQRGANRRLKGSCDAGNIEIFMEV